MNDSGPAVRSAPVTYLRSVTICKVLLVQACSICFPHRPPPAGLGASD
jgi:hypothetical protein